MNLATVNSYIITRNHVEDIAFFPFPFFEVRKGHDAVISQVAFTGNEYKLSLERQPNLVKEFNVTEFPTIIYTTPKNGGQEVLLRLEGFQISEENTGDALLFLGGLTVDGEGNYQSDNQDWSPIYGFGLDVFGLNNLLWGFLALYAGKGFLDANSNVGQIVYGSIAAYSTTQALKNGK